MKFYKGVIFEIVQNRKTGRWAVAIRTPESFDVSTKNFATREEAEIHLDFLYKEYVKVYEGKGKKLNGYA